MEMSENLQNLSKSMFHDHQDFQYFDGLHYLIFDGVWEKLTIFDFNSSNESDLRKDFVLAS